MTLKKIVSLYWQRGISSSFGSFDSVYPRLVRLFYQNLHWNVAFNGVLFSYIDGVKVSITKADITRHSLVLTPLRVMIFLGMLCPLAPLFVRCAAGVLVPMGLALGELICPLVFGLLIQSLNLIFFGVIKMSGVVIFLPRCMHFTVAFILICPL